MSARTSLDLARAAQMLFRAIETIRGELADLSGLSLTELRALTRIAESSEFHPSEIAAALGVGLPAMTSISDRLLRQKLITRTPDPSDRRKVFLRATDAGQEIARRADEHFVARISEAAKGLDATAMTDLTETMSAISSRL